MGNKFSVSYAYSSLSAGMVKFGNGWNKPHTENKGFGVHGTHARGKEKGGGGGYEEQIILFFFFLCHEEVETATSPPNCAAGCL